MNSNEVMSLNVAIWPLIILIFGMYACTVCNWADFSVGKERQKRYIEMVSFINFNRDDNREKF